MAASKGLGRAVATELAREGASVVITSRDEETLAQTAAEIADKMGAEVEPRSAYITRAEDVQALFSQAVDRFGGPEVLVNNTCGPHVGTFDNFGDKDWQAAFELVLLSLIRALRGSLSLMRQRGGYIVNIASSSIKQPIENLIFSNTFRAGILGFAKSLSVELAPDGILINTLGPGRISTARSQSIDERNAEAARVPVEEVRGRVEWQTPLARYGAPEELARVAAFVASPANN